MLAADHRIFRINSIKYLEPNTWVSSKPDTRQIGNINCGGKEAPVYLADGNSQKNIYVQDTWDIRVKDAYGKYIAFTYLCDDVISLNGRKWELASPLPTFAGFSAFWPIHPAGTGSDAASSEITKDKYMFIWVPDFSTENRTAYIDKPLGTLTSGGTLYAIKGTDPDEAVLLNVGDNWYLIAFKMIS